MHKTLHLAVEFYHLVYNRKTKGTKVTKIISLGVLHSPLL